MYPKQKCTELKTFSLLATQRVQERWIRCRPSQTMARQIHLASQVSLLLHTVFSHKIPVSREQPWAAGREGTKKSFSLRFNTVFHQYFHDRVYALPQILKMNVEGLIESTSLFANSNYYQQLLQKHVACHFKTSLRLVFTERIY